MTGICISQNELAQRWQISQTTLERWRAQQIGPSFLKLGGQVRYRLIDITAFEEQTLQVMSLQKPDVDCMSKKIAPQHEFTRSYERLSRGCATLPPWTL